MSEFLDIQAEESDVSRDSDDSDLHEPKAKRSKRDKEKRKKKKKKARISDDEEDEEDDDKRLNEEMAGFVVEEASDVEEEASNASDSPMEEEISDDELDLILENTGRQKPNRVVVEDDEDDRGPIERVSSNKRHHQKKRDEDQESRRSYDDDQDSDDLDNDSEDNFIVDDNPDQRRPKKSHHRQKSNFQFSSEAMQEANDVFGINEMDYSELYDDVDDYQEDEEGAYRTKKSQILKSRKKMAVPVHEDTEANKLRALILCTDKPERFMTRGRPVTEENSREEIFTEATWIFENGLLQDKLLTEQDVKYLDFYRNNAAKIFEEDKKTMIIQAISTVLDGIRNQGWEAPFMYKFRKELITDDIDPEETSLAINELWKIYYMDEAYCIFKEKKDKLFGMFNRMDTYIRHCNDTRQTGYQTIDPSVFAELQAARTKEALADVQAYFNLHYNSHLKDMYAFEKTINDPETLMQNLSISKFKKISRNDMYTTAVNLGMKRFGDFFGLSSEDIAFNCKDRINNTREAEMTDVSPEVAAIDFRCSNFPNSENVIKGGIFVKAKELASLPKFREAMRARFFETASISMKLTKKGEEDIGMGHPLWRCRYVSHKPVKSFKDDQFLFVIQAAKQDQIKYEIHDYTVVEKENDEMEDSSGLPTTNRYRKDRPFMDYFIEKKVFQSDKISENATAWNKLREAVLLMAWEKFLRKDFERELVLKMAEEATETVLSDVTETFKKKFYVQPFVPELANDNDQDDDESIRHGVRIMAVVTNTKEGESTTAVILDGEGNIIDTDVFPYISNRFCKGPLKFDREGRTKNIEKLKDLIERRKPHGIAIAAENVDSTRILKIFQEAILDLKMANRIRRDIDLKLVDGDVAHVFSNSEMAENEFSGQSLAFKSAMSLGRFYLDPLLETTHLCNAQKDFLKLKLNPLQEYISADVLEKHWTTLMVNFLAGIGVDINRCATQEHAFNALQFVPGFGPIKADFTKRAILNCDQQMCTGRSNLIMHCKMTTNLFLNSAAFLRFDLAKIQDVAGDEIEPLDGTRIHPEFYELAKKMAMDTLDKNDEDDATDAVEECLKDPLKLNQLDLPQFIQTLKENNFGEYGHIIRDMKIEFKDQFRDRRFPAKTRIDDDGKEVPNYPKTQSDEKKAAELFEKLVHEDPLMYPVGKIVCANVIRAAYKPLGDKMSEEVKGYPADDHQHYKCSYCQQENFNNPDDVVDHVRKKECPGQLTGLRGELSNGISVFVNVRYVIDGCQQQDDLDKRAMFKNINEGCRIVRNAQPGSQIIGRIRQVNIEKISLDLSCNPAALRDDYAEFSGCDECFDWEHVDHVRSEENKKPVTKAVPITFINRVISHSLFHNVSFKQAEEMLGDAESGEAIIRPSSKATDKLVITWKVADGIFQHVDILEKNKSQPFSLGKILIIGSEKYEELDEIMARYVQPLADGVRSIQSHRYYKSDIYGEDDINLNELLVEEKKQDTKRIPYFFVASKSFPGKFAITYLPRDKIRKEYFTPTTEGFRFRTLSFQTLDNMINWFKKNHHKPLPSNNRHGGHGNN